MKIKKTKNINIYLMIIFISISFFSSIGFSTIQSSILDKNANGIYNDADSVSFYFETKENDINKEQYKSNDLINIITGPYIGRVIYFNYNIDLTPSMIEGRYFNVDDFEIDRSVAVVGKNVKDMIITDDDGKKYLEYEKVKYEIIGIMGEEGRECICDNQFILNYNSYAKKNLYVNSNSQFVINNMTNFQTLKKLLLNQNINLLMEDKNENDMIGSLIDSKSSILLLIILIVLIFLNVFNITIQWVGKKKKEIAIKKAVGGTNLKIALEIIMQNLKIATISFFIGYAVYIIVMKIQLIPVLSSKIYIMVTIVSMVFSLFISLLTSMVSIYKILKIEPAITMKG